MRLRSLVAVVILSTAFSASAIQFVRQPDDNEKKKLLGIIRYPTFDLTLQFGFYLTDSFLSGTERAALKKKENEARRAVSGGRATPRQLSLYADSLLRNGKSEEARKYRFMAVHGYQRLLRKNKNDTTLLADLASEWRQLNRYERAVSLYSKALKMKPGDTELRISLASTYAVLQRWNDVAKVVNMAIKDDPKNPELYLNMQMLARSRLISRHPEFVSREVKAGRFGKMYSLKWINHATSLKPSDFRFNFIRRFLMTDYIFFRISFLSGFSHLRKKQPLPLTESEIKILKKNAVFFKRILTSEKPAKSFITRILAMNYLTLGKVDNAIAVLKNRLKTHPEDEYAYEGLYALLMLQGDYSGFVALIRKKIRVVAAIRDYLILAKVEYKKPDFPAALLLIRRALVKAPRSGKGLSALAAVQTRMGKPEEALKTLKTIPATSAEYLKSLYLRACLALVLNRPDEAFKAIDILLKKQPDYKVGREFARKWFNLR